MGWQDETGYNYKAVSRVIYEVSARNYALLWNLFVMQMYYVLKLEEGIRERLTLPSRYLHRRWQENKYGYLQGNETSYLLRPIGSCMLYYSVRKIYFSYLFISHHLSKK